MTRRSTAGGVGRSARLLRAVTPRDSLSVLQGSNQLNPVSPVRQLARQFKRSLFDVFAVLFGALFLLAIVLSFAFSILILFRVV